jgi:rRNA-processing protein FCF1
MRRVILDTSFILTAVRQKVDFFEIIESRGFQILIPEQVFKELRGLGAELALKIVRSKKFKLVSLQGKDADSAILKFAKKNPMTVVATLDEGLKKKLKNRKMIIRQRKKIEITG